jgi:hypothetical protein
MAAEVAGFDAVWITGGAAAGGVPTCDPCVLAGGLALSTTTLTLGIVAGIGPDDRPPSVLGREVTTLDVLTGGRAAVLLCAGSDGDVGGVAAAALRARLAEAVTVCRMLMTEEGASYEGRYFRLVHAENRPRPVRAGGPPVLAQGLPDELVAVSPPGGAHPGPGDAPGGRIWRGTLDVAGGAAPSLAAALDDGVDGVIVCLSPAGLAPGVDRVREAAGYLTTLMPRRSS